MLKKKIENKQSRLRLAVIMLALVMTVTGCSGSSEKEEDTRFNGTWLSPDGAKLYFNGTVEIEDFYSSNGSFKMSFDDDSIISGEYDNYWVYYDNVEGGRLSFKTKQVRGTIPIEWFDFFINTNYMGSTSTSNGQLVDWVHLQAIYYVLNEGLDAFTSTYYHSWDSELYEQSGDGAVYKTITFTKQ